MADAELHAEMRHPDFEYRTTEGPRKQWDDVDVPPADENGDPDPTWERNTDAGRDGWDRFDYTEESYWRRRKTQTTEPAAEDAQRAAASINDGLDRLFRRLGPPTDHDEK